MKKIFSIFIIFMSIITIVLSVIDMIKEPSIINFCILIFISITMMFFVIYGIKELLSCYCAIEVYRGKKFDVLPYAGEMSNQKAYYFGWMNFEIWFFPNEKDDWYPDGKQ